MSPLEVGLSSAPWRSWIDSVRGSRVAREGIGRVLSLLALRLGIAPGGHHAIGWRNEQAVWEFGAGVLRRRANHYGFCVNQFRRFVNGQLASFRNCGDRR